MDFIHQLLPNDILQALGWTVLHSLWQAFAVALLLAAYLLAWQKTDARKRYAAGNVALGSILLLALGTFVFYLNKSQAEPELAGEIWSDDGELLGRYFIEDTPSFFSEYFTEHMPLIVSVWCIGFVFFMLKLMGGLLYVQQLRTRMTSPLQREWQEYVAVLCAEMNILRPVQLLESALAQTPMVLGWMKPVILLPVGAVNHLTPTQVEAILAHEIAHVLRQDYLLNLLQSIVETIFYFNPAVWWVSAHVRTERENCCDDIAVRYCGNSLAYAKALVSLQELQMATPALAMGFSKNKNQLLHRIKRILQPSQNKSNVMEKLSATLLLTVAVVLLSVQANTPFGNFLTKVVSCETPIFEPAEASTPYDEMEEYPTEVDTIPDGVQDAHFHISTNDEQVEVRVENGKISFLEVDGEVIPPSRYGEYEEQVQEILANMPEPPDAPEFPGFPAMPAPPAPPSFEGFPAPAAPPAPGARKITTQKDRNGTTFLIETEDGSDPVEIIVKDGKKGTIIVNGQEITGLKKGDKTIIMQDVPGNSFYWNGEMAPPDAFHFDFPALAEFSKFDAAAMAELEALRGEALAPEVFEFRTPRPNKLWALPEMQAMRERLDAGDFSSEWMEDYLRDMPKSEQWYAQMDEIMAQGNENQKLMLERQQQKIDELRAAMETNRERAIKDSKKMQERQLEELEQQKKAMENMLKQFEKEHKELQRASKKWGM
ncbi:MAG: M48 family metalloprotease [Saprospiraceae bacterium]|nr:M48 family metalloprotease [Saprospiraceae bacterium]